VFADDAVDTVDLLVCADGVGSRSRAHLLPDVRARYSGYVAWRGMVPEHTLASAVRDRLADAITYCLYANSHILLYPIPGHDGSVSPGERLINFVWYPGGSRRRSGRLAGLGARAARSRPPTLGPDEAHRCPLAGRVLVAAG